jgi:hypothetical protein
MLCFSIRLIAVTRKNQPPDVSQRRPEVKQVEVCIAASSVRVSREQRRKEKLRPSVDGVAGNTGSRKESALI